MFVCILNQFKTATCTSQIIPFIYAMEKFIDYACDNVEGTQKVVNDLHIGFNRWFKI